MPEDIVARFRADFPERDLVAIAATIILACRKSAEAVRARYREDYPKSHILGQERYHDIQNALLDLKLAGVTCRSERHPHGSTFFTSIESDDARLTTRKVDERAEEAPPTLFREREQALQLSFNFHKVVGEVQIVMETVDTPKYIDVRFPDGRGDYIEDFIDLMALVSEPVPEEHVEDKRAPKTRPVHERPRKDIFNRNQNDQA